MAEPTPLRADGARIARTAQAVSARVLEDVDGVLAQIEKILREEIPEYAAMSQQVMGEEIMPNSRRAVTSFFDAFLGNKPASRKDMRAFEASGATRLEMGVPLDSVLHAYRIAGRVVWSSILAVIRPGEEHVLGVLAAGWIDHIDHLASGVAKGYLAASHVSLRRLDARRRELLEAILAAENPSEVAAVSLRFSTVLASAYVPVLVAREQAVARIDTVLEAAPRGTLGGHHGEHLLLLVPEISLDVTVLHNAAGGLLAWGRPAQPGPKLLEEVRHLVSVLEAAVAEHCPEGAYGPDDLLVEQLLLGNERVAAALRRRVRDVLMSRDPAGGIVSTLRVYLETGSVPETAKRAIVHPNTVTYRLGRVRELTGLDPRVPAQAALLVLGLGLADDPREAQ